MGYGKLAWIAALAVAVGFAGGCGNQVKSAASAPAKLFGRAADAVKSPFKNSSSATASADTNVEGRFSTDDYRSATASANASTSAGNASAARANVTEEAPVASGKPEAISKAGLSVDGEKVTSAGDFGSLFEREHSRLEQNEKLLNDQAYAMEQELQAKQQAVAELRDRQREVLERKSKLERIMNGVEPTQSEVASAGFNGMKMGQKVPAGVYGGNSAGAQDFSSCAVPNGNANYTPPVETDFNRGAGASATTAAQSDPLARLGLPQPEAAAPVAAPTKLTTSIIAIDTPGAPQVVMLGAGMQNGVAKGMCFKAIDVTGSTVVLVVDKVYATYSSAYLHPKFNEGGVQVGDRVSLIDPAALEREAKSGR